MKSYGFSVASWVPTETATHSHWEPRVSASEEVDLEEGVEELSGVSLL